MSFPFIEENTASRQNLAALANHLSDNDLALVTPYGWSIAALFAHLTWWDQRVLVLLRRWKENGIDESPVDSELINDALKPLCHALEPRTAISLCLASAEETDAEIATTPAALVAQIEASSNHFRFNRALHRNDHINDVERLIQRGETTASP